MKRIILILGVVLLLSAIALSEPIQLIDCWEAWSISAPGNNFTDGNWTFGEIFIANQTVKIDMLGYYIPPGGFTSPHPVGIFDAWGNLLLSTVIDNHSIYQYPYFMFNITSPLILQAGQIYVIEGVSNTDPYTWNDPGFFVRPEFTILGNNWVLNNDLNFNGLFFINDVADGYWGPNFGVTPEPGTLVLVATGLLGALQTMRRK